MKNRFAYWTVYSLDNPRNNKIRVNKIKKIQNTLKHNKALKPVQIDKQAFFNMHTCILLVIYYSITVYSNSLRSTVYSNSLSSILYCKKISSLVYCEKRCFC
jgi:hypothetical protein